MKKFLILSLAVLGIAAMSNTVNADEKKTNLIEPIVPTHQTEEVSSFYDFNWVPGETDSLGIKINNSSDNDKTYTVSVNDSQTNENGVLVNSGKNSDLKDIKGPSVKDLIVFKSEITVKAKSSEVLTTEYTMSEENFSGIAMGGVVITEKTKNDNSKQFNQKISYILPVIIHGNETKPEVSVTFNDDFSFKKVGSGIYSILTPFVNENANWLKDAKAELVIKDSTGKEVITDEKTIEIAPQNKVYYAPQFENDLASGKYEVTITITTKSDKVFTSTKTVTLTKDEANDIAKTVNIGEKKKSSIYDNPFFYVTIALAMLVVGYASGKIIRKTRKRRHQ